MKLSSFLILTIIVSLISCSSYSSIQYSKTQVYTEEKVQLSVDTLPFYDHKSNHHIIRYRKRIDPVPIAWYNDSTGVKDTIKLEPNKDINYHGVRLISSFLYNDQWLFNFLLSYPNYIFIGANDSSYLKYIPSRFLKRRNIKLNPIGLIDPYFPRISLAFERAYLSRLSSELVFEIGLPSTVYNTEVYWPHNATGFGLRYNQKLFVRPSSPVGLYIGANIAYKYQNYSLADSYTFVHETSNDIIHGIDTFQVRKEVQILNSILGYQYKYNDWMIDSYVGVGLRYISTSFSNTVEVPTGYLVSRNFLELDVDYEGERVLPNIILFGIRIGKMF